MSLFAIGDLHLSLGMDKPMHIFGDIWENHSKKIEDSWRRTVKETDTVLLPGDISWGMDLQEAKPDLDFISALPGRKIVMRGNHDYWWTSITKMQGCCPALSFLKNNFIPYGEIAICGTRGWLCPGHIGFTPKDQKIYDRELLRLQLSFRAAEIAGFRKYFVMLHYPPFNEYRQPSGFTELLHTFHVPVCIYGHIHGKEAFEKCVNGPLDGIEYRLVSADFLEFAPKKVLD